jgi:hypothetical protein
MGVGVGFGVNVAGGRVGGGRGVEVADVVRRLQLVNSKFKPAREISVR